MKRIRKAVAFYLHRLACRLDPEHGFQFWFNTERHIRLDVEDLVRRSKARLRREKGANGN